MRDKRKKPRIQGNKALLGLCPVDAEEFLIKEKYASHDQDSVVNFS